MTLDERAEEALRRIREGLAPMRIPADLSDPDIVISELRHALAAAEKALATARAEALQEAAAYIEKQDGGFAMHVYAADIRALIGKRAEGETT